ncbi:MAG: heavy-metal-associated domain-containing protein [Alphaproteobacteria bacterium]|nr:heavy-metal-associated domain-containing protein [Alphaproteobacteria bacterium]
MKKNFFKWFFLLLVIAAVISVAVSNVSKDQTKLSKDYSSNVGYMHSHEAEALSMDSSVVVEEGYVVLQVNGFVCELCGKKTRKALSELPFVEDVMVNIEKQTVTIAIKEGFAFDENLVVKAIKSHGFSPYMIYKNVDGKTIAREI